MHICTIKTSDRNTCRYPSSQCGRIPSAHNCGSRLQPAQLNEMILFVLKNYNDGGEISQIKPMLLCTLCPKRKWRCSRTEYTGELNCEIGVSVTASNEDCQYERPSLKVVTSPVLEQPTSSSASTHTIDKQPCSWKISQFDLPNSATATANSLSSFSG